MANVGNKLYFFVPICYNSPICKKEAMRIMEMEKLSALVCKVQQGDRQAADELYTATCQGLYYYIMRSLTMKTALWPRKNTSATTGV
jgi:hypothetical protein